VKTATTHRSTHTAASHRGPTCFSLNILFGLLMKSLTFVLSMLVVVTLPVTDSVAQGTQNAQQQRPGLGARLRGNRPQPQATQPGQTTQRNQAAQPGQAAQPANPAANRPQQGNQARQARQPREPRGQNMATAVERITVADGFKVELLYSIPAQQQGSWVNLCTDGKGRILASDQYGGLYRFDPPAAGQPLNPASISKVPADIRAVNGMVWINDALYVGVNDYESKIPSGLYRLTDSNGDDQLDKVELLRELEARGDHGIHAVVPTPDGKAIYLICGNATKPTQWAEGSAVPQVWGEDHLLPRLPDGRGFMRDVLGPGGVIYEVSLDDHAFRAVAVGFRNIFDAAVNHDGELFTYDADMEYDFNTSWYRPTRINHVVSGGEFGWRNGAGKRPDFYADTLPTTLDIGPGSPTGMTFGYGAKFPAKYQNALYALDWSWGKLYAIHLQPDGATYSATKEDFLTGAPLPITDAIIHPGDGAMYFAIGGRRVQSGLYRVSYVGSEDTSPVPPQRTQTAERSLRHQLEAFHGKVDPQAIAFAWPHLASSDRHIRWAARTAVEHQPPASWAEQALSESDPAIQVEALLALARVTGVCPPHRTDATPPVDQAMGNQLLEALMAIDPQSLDLQRQLTLVRTMQITLNRFGRPHQATIARLIERLDPLFPSTSRDMNWLLCETLVYLQSPTVADKALALIAKAPTQEEQIEYARSLRMLTAGWTVQSRAQYFQWFLKAANYTGGASFEKFIEFIRNDAVESLSDDHKKQLAELLQKQPERKSPLESLGEIFAGRESNDWTLQQLSAAAASDLSNRDFAQGRKMFAAAACYACHRFNNEGGMTGPDLSTAGKRYSANDLLDHIIHPSKEINEQFSSVVVLTDAGQLHTGVVVNLNGDTITLNTDLTDPNRRVTIDRNEVESLEPSKVSAMPEKLLDRMTQEEVLDLVAYVLSGGDAKHAYFKQ
jgi:putative heme-binding domain-containing protein